MHDDLPFVKTVAAVCVYPHRPAGDGGSLQPGALPFPVQPQVETPLPAAEVVAQRANFQHFALAARVEFLGQAMPMLAILGVAFAPRQLPAGVSRPKGFVRRTDEVKQLSHFAEAQTFVKPPCHFVIGAYLQPHPMGAMFLRGGQGLLH